MVKRVVILGGAGFIGSHLTHALIEAGYNVRVFQHPRSSMQYIRHLPIEVQRGDMNDPDAIISALQNAHTAIHLIHSTVPISSMQDAAQDVIQNIGGSVRWLAQLNKTPLQRLIYFSSGGTVYGNPQTVPIDETHPTEPLSSYGITKLAIEKYVTMYSHLYNIQPVILRPSNIYGPHQKLNISQGVIGVMLDRAIRGETFEMWGNGSSLRDYLYIADVAQAVVQLMSYEGNEHIFHLASGNGTTLNELIRLVNEQTGVSLKISKRTAMKHAVDANVLSYRRLHHATGWRPHTSLADGVALTMEWINTIRDHPLG